MAERDQGRRKITARLVWAAVLLAPIVILWCGNAVDAAHHKSPTDWQGNHEAKLAFVNAFMIIVGAPLIGAFLGRVYGAVRRAPHPGATAAGGALLGVLGLYAFGVYMLYEALTHITIVF
jgi:hypothetical protein